MDYELIYTDSQLKVMAIVPKITSFISLTYMSYAAQLIIRSRRRRRMYHSLFLGMAAHDIIRNLTFIVGTWAIPKGSPGYFMAWGNHASCSLQAFFSLASFGVFTYVCAVCLFSYYAVRYDCKEESYKRFERIAHVLCTLIPVGFAIALVSFGLQGPDGVSRCMMPSYGMACRNLAYAEAHCTDGHLHAGTAASIFIMHHSLTSISFGIGISSILVMIFVETKKRKKNQCLQGKRLYIETARKKKSKQNLILSGSHLLVTFGANCVYRISRNYACELSFGFGLFAVIMTTLTGFFNAIIYLSVKRLNKCEDATSELLSKHSIRKSIRSVENVSVVSGGYQPKKQSRLATVVGTSAADFGIFVGSDNEVDDDEVDDDDVAGCNYGTNVSFREPLFDSVTEGDNHLTCPDLGVCDTSISQESQAPR